MEAGRPVDGLNGFVVDADERLPGRVGRSINRRLLAADAADFSLSVFFRTIWEYVTVAMDVFGSRTDRRPDHRPERDRDPKSPEED